MRTNRLLSFFTILIIVLAEFLLNMTFAPKISWTAMIIVRIALFVLFFMVWRVLSKKKESTAKNIAFTLMVVNLAFFIVSFFTANLWGLNLESAKGIALAKLSDSFIISIVLIISFIIGGFQLKDIYLTKGKLALGLMIGIVSFIIMGYLAIISTKHPLGTEFLSKNLVWIFLFVISNGFMEELLFRGIFLKQLNNILKPVWTIALTSIVFALAHLQVNYTPDILFFTGILLILGMIWGFLMYYTQSIIASMLFHAGADLMIIMPVLYSFGVTG